MSSPASPGLLSLPCHSMNHVLLLLYDNLCAFCCSCYDPSPSSRGTLLVPEGSHSGSPREAHGRFFINACWISECRPTDNAVSVRGLLLYLVTPRHGVVSFSFHSLGYQINPSSDGWSWSPAHPPSSVTLKKVLTLFEHHGPCPYNELPTNIHLMRWL